MTDWCLPENKLESRFFIFLMERVKRIRGMRERGRKLEKGLREKEIEKDRLPRDRFTETDRKE